MDLKNKKVLVAGLGITGRAVVDFLQEAQAIVKAVDSCRSEEMRNLKKTLKQRGIEVEIGPHKANTFLESDLIVTSPGVPFSSGPIEEARKAGVEVIAEIELAFQHLTFPVIAVTGTNGKTTAVSIIGDILKSKAKNVFVGGNIGNPLINAVKGNFEVGVVEVSSFQLLGIKRFRPEISILLNITEDHLNMHNSLESYIKAKARIFENQGREDFAIINLDDRNTVGLKRQIKSKVFEFSLSRSVERGAYLLDNLVCWKNGDEEENYPLDRIKIKGSHNLENIMAVICALRIYGLEREVIKEGIESFEGLPHRLESLGKIKGVEYYNDSKGTNVGSVIKSLETFPGNVLLIAGGRDKEGDFHKLRSLVKGRVKKLILLGEAREKIKTAIGDLTETSMVDSLEDGVLDAYNSSSPDDVVLLSPGCASFDMFKNFKERGEVFQKTVEGLRERS